MLHLHTRADVDAALGATLAVVYKHSSRCSVSFGAHAQVARFARDTTVPVYMLDVVDDRAISDYIAERMAVPHQSPQVILVCRGVAAWHASHHRVTAASLHREMELAIAP